MRPTTSVQLADALPFCPLPFSRLHRVIHRYIYMNIYMYMNIYFMEASTPIIESFSLLFVLCIFLQEQTKKHKYLHRTRAKTTKLNNFDVFVWYYYIFHAFHILYCAFCLIFLILIANTLFAYFVCSILLFVFRSKTLSRIISRPISTKNSIELHRWVLKFCTPNIFYVSSHF